MSTELATINPETVRRLDEIANNYQLARADQSPFAATFSTAVAMKELRQLLTPEVMAPIMELMNSPLGFLTDRTGRPNWKGEVKKPYPVETVRDVLIESTLRGFHPVGNEFNILADRFYAAKAGLRRKVSSFPGLTEFRDTYGVPKVVKDSSGNDTGALVESTATWKLNGVADSLTRTFPCKGDKYAGADSYIGKATRKLLAAVYERLYGHSVPEGEADEFDLNGMKQASGSEVNYDDEHERAMQQWRIDCQAIETYNAKLKEQGVPQDQWEPMPPMPVQAEVTDAPKSEPAPEPTVIPWREVIVTQFNALKGKKLGDLNLDMLRKIRDSINNVSSPEIQRKKGLAALIGPVEEGIEELARLPADAPPSSPAEVIRGLLKKAGASEKDLLDYWLNEKKKGPGSFRNLVDANGEEIIDQWPEIATKLTARSAGDAK